MPAFSRPRQRGFGLYRRARVSPPIFDRGHKNIHPGTVFISGGSINSSLGVRHTIRRLRDFVADVSLRTFCLDPEGGGGGGVSGADPLCPLELGSAEGCLRSDVLGLWGEPDPISKSTRHDCTFVLFASVFYLGDSVVARHMIWECGCSSFLADGFSWRDLGGRLDLRILGRTCQLARLSVLWPSRFGVKSQKGGRCKFEQGLEFVEQGEAQL